jgi:ribonuclease III
MKEEERAELEASLGHRFVSSDRLEHALTHRSHRQTADGVDNERLEFLGDRVVGLLASQELCRLFPEWNSGKLSKGLARLVSAPSLHGAAQRLNLGTHLRLGPGEEKTGGREKKRLLADAYEAVVGAIYLDAGIEAAGRFVQRTLLDFALSAQLEGLEYGDHKSLLQEWLQERGLGPVEYRVRNESGPDHQKTFEVEVWLKGQKLSASKGQSKKEAEQAAARLALGTLGALEQGSGAGA